MKLPSLLTEFLYKNKRLSLPGIGIFTLDPSAVIPDAYNKNMHTTAAGIEFKNASIHESDDDLIEYIRSHTGKIRPVAVADLASYLALGTEMLNIGKPFYLEGIGTLTKNKEGFLEFTQGEYTIVKHESLSADRPEKPGKRKSVLEEAQYEPQPNSIRRLLVFVAIIGGLAVIGGGGYLMYKKNVFTENKNESNAIVNDTTNNKKDTVQLASIADSLTARRTEKTPALSSSRDSVLYKFIILETANKAHALKRYNQLLSYELKIKMFTRDSNYFKVYFTFPAAPKDTIHIKDSLFREYAHKITIER